MDLSVTIAQGRLQGRSRGPAQLFAAIPYAAPPVGALRFARPAAAPTWDGVRDASSFGPAAPQLPGEGLTNAVPIAWDEDSLTLNVMTPAADGGSRPVMVWIHGGDFKNGTGATPWYDGTSFASNGDIVVVTINYRMGAFGFARFNDHGSHAETSSINGLLDQVAALEWVRDNIAAFGGDPNRVTIAGESAGAFSVGALLAMPAAAGLFHGAILQSGASHNVLSADHGQAVADKLLESANVSSFDELQGLSAMDLLAAQKVVETTPPKQFGANSPFYPSVDSDQLPAVPIELLADGRSADVPVLLGTNAHESTLFGMHSVPEDKLDRLMGRYVDDAPTMVERYRQAMPGASAGEIAVALTSDRMFTVPAARLAETREPHGAKTWNYLFTWESRAFDGALGATHALEIPFTFNALGAPGVDLFLGPGESPQPVADAMHSAWTAFIQTGDPNTDTNPAWPTYDSGDRQVMEFGDRVGLLSDPNPQRRQAWDGLR